MLTTILASAAELPPDQLEFFEAKVRPIFVEHCYKCHSTESGKSKGGLTLDSRYGVRKGGETGPAIVSGDPEKSLLIEAVRYKSDDLQMPPPDEGGPLSPEKIAVLEQWIKMGAPDPREGGKANPLDFEKARTHWAFQPVVKPAVPEVSRGVISNAVISHQAALITDSLIADYSTAIDAFVRAKLAEHGIAPARTADKRTLLRRVTYDLTGLPPTPAEMDAFLADPRADAYQRVVERLLASPHYGERWGRFWLDVARYADTKGYLAGNVERRYPFSHTYRDYVIRAFNEDKPYDRFIIEQIAADRLPLGEDKSPLAALGFLTLGRRFLNNQNDIIDDRIDVVTRGLMGLTVSCARCHDHKFDPIPTRDYYALHGVFASSEEPAEEPLLGPLVESPAYEQFLNKRAALEGKIKAREADEVKKFLKTAREKTGDYLLAVHDRAGRAASEKIDVFAGVRKLNVEVLKRWEQFLTAEANRKHPAFAPWFTALAAETNSGGTAVSGPEAGPIKDLAAAYNRVASKAGELANDPSKTATATSAPAELDPDALREFFALPDAPPNLPYATVAAMLRREIGNKTAPLRREIEALNWTEAGAPQRAMALVDKSAPANSPVLIRGNPANRGPEAPRQFLAILSGDRPAPLIHGSGRLDLAEQIASAKNPLTARVFVNRVWGWHFGQPLVPTPSDFGVRTAAPIHRELLDWLAASFVEHGWSVKWLHRAIVLSSTYRQSCETDSAMLAVDPDNQLFAHCNRHRLEFEALRDTLLAVAGNLDERAGGTPDELTKEPFPHRRTVYGFIDRQNLPGMFRTFDYPNPDVSSAGRFATTVPQQALFMMNSAFVQQQARELVRRAEQECGGTKAPAKVVLDGPVTEERSVIRRLYQIVYQREPDAEEASLAEAFLSRPDAGEPATSSNSKSLTREEELAQVLLLSNELAFVD